MKLQLTLWARCKFTSLTQISKELGQIILIKLILNQWFNMQNSVMWIINYLILLLIMQINMEKSGLKINISAS